MKLKMCIKGKIFNKMCLKAIRNTFFQYVVCNQGKNGMKHEGKGEYLISWWSVTSKRRVRFKILSMSGKSSPLVANLEPP